MNKAIPFILTILITLSCCKENIINDGTEQPCLDCPFDFRLTDYEPAWSPDRHTIAYVHGDTSKGKTGIWLIDTAGTNKRILYASASAYCPSWSPNGEWIVFADQAQIHKIKINGDSLTQLTNEGRNFFPDWSPDGLWIVYDSDLNDTKGSKVIWKMLHDGTQKKDISQHRTGEWRMPDWSPDGRQIIHQRYISIGSPEIYVMDSTGGNPKRLTVNSAFDRYPRYSHDGTKIAYTSQPVDGVCQIWLMNSNGTDNFQLTTTQGYSCDWSPDGEWIVYTDSRAISGKLWLIKSNGSNNHQFTF